MRLMIFLILFSGEICAQEFRQTTSSDLVKTATLGGLIDAFRIEIPAPSGICFDGEAFWVPNYAASKGERALYRIDFRNRQITSLIVSPERWSTGMAWDGANLWVMDGYPLHQVSLIKMSPDGKIVDLIPAVYSCYWAGIAWDGSNLYYGVNTCGVPESRPASMIYKANPINGAILDSIPPPSGNINGLTFDGTSLWYCDANTRKIYKITIDGTVLLSFFAPSFTPSGLTIAKGYLWSVDFSEQMIYQIDIGVAPGVPTGFNGSVERGAVRLTWAANPDSDLVGYRIYRSRTSNFPDSSLLDSLSSSQTSYLDVLSSFDHAYSYYYWVSSVDSSGFESHHSQSVLVDIVADPTIRQTFILYQNYPNPFNPNTRIPFGMPEDSFVKITVNDINGREIRILIDQFLESGFHQIEWNGKGANGQNVSSGVYFCRLTAIGSNTGVNTQVVKLTLTR